jgi:hypothetical protein
MWSEQDQEHERRQFVSARRARVSRSGLALVFSATALVAWGATAALLALGVESMPVRYAVACVAGYAAFFGCVRVWADFQRSRSSDGLDAGDAVDLADMASVDGEGCAIVLLVAVAFFAAVAALTAFGATGFVAVMLEAAFEVVFAGTVVRTSRGMRTVGDWYAVLWRKTALPAGLLAAALVGFAAWVQHSSPEVVTLGQWLRQFF